MAEWILSRHALSFKYIKAIETLQFDENVKLRLGDGLTDKWETNHHFNNSRKQQLIDL